jgi:anti-sigma B factor antagonist
LLRRAYLLLSLRFFLFQCPQDIHESSERYLPTTLNFPSLLQRLVEDANLSLELLEEPLWAFKSQSGNPAMSLFWTFREERRLALKAILLSDHLQKLVANGVRKLLLNLADIRQLDSSGISAIVGTHSSLGRQGGSLKLLCPWGRVRAVLRVIRLPDVIPTFEDETQALASFRPLRYFAKP